MKILYFHQHFSTPKGAAGTRSHSIAKNLVNEGHEVTLICGSYQLGMSGLEGPFDNGIRRGTVDGINVIELQLPYANNDKFIKRIITFVRFALRSTGFVFTEKYDVVFASSTPLTASIPGIVAKLFRRKPFVFEVRDLWPELPKKMGVIKNPIILFLMSILEWMSYRLANHCVALAPGIKDGIVKRGVSESKVSMIPNSSDVEYFSRSHENVDSVIGKIFGEKPKCVAVFAGAHGLANGLSAVLDTATELKQRGNADIKLLFVGDGMLKKSLMQRASDEGLDNCVFHAPLAKDELSRLLTEADVGLMTLANVKAFYYGTSPNKFFDYIACGLPVINNYPGWIAGLITENNCGMAVSPDDPKQFADALESFAELSDSEKQAMKARAKALAVSQFNRKRMVEEVATVLKRVYQPA